MREGSHLFLFLIAAQFGFQTELIETRPRTAIYACSLEDGHGARVHCVLVEPRGKRGKLGGVVFQHGGGQTMMQYISEASMLAESGVVALIIDPPGKGRPNDMQKMNGAEIRDWMFEIAAAGSRAIDILIARGDVDPARIAFVGHSYGANAAAIISGRDKRPAVYVLIGGTSRLSEHIRISAIDFWKAYRQRGDLDLQLKPITEADAANFLPTLKARAVLVQCARFDMPDLMKSCPAVHDTLQVKKHMGWYPTGHAFADTKAGVDRIAFLRRHLKR